MVKTKTNPLPGESLIDVCWGGKHKNVNLFLMSPNLNDKDGTLLHNVFNNIMCTKMVFMCSKTLKSPLKFKRKNYIKIEILPLCPFRISSKIVKPDFSRQIIKITPLIYPASPFRLQTSKGTRCYGVMLVSWTTMLFFFQGLL